MASTDDSDWGEFLQWDDPDALQDPPLHLPASLPANNYEEEAQKGNANESKASNGELQLPTPCSDPIDFDISDWPQNISAIDAFDTILKGVGTEETQQFIAAPTSEPPNSSPQAFNHADFTVQPVISPLHDSIAHVSTGLLPSSSFQNLGSADFSLGPVISTQNNSFANTGIGDVYLAEDSYPLIDPAFPQIANPYTIQHYPYPYLFQSQYDSSPANMMVFNNPPYISHQSWNDLDFMAQLPSPLMDAYMGVNHSPASFIHTGNDSIQLEWHPSRLEKDAPPLDSLGHSSNERDEISQDGTPKTQLPPARDITSSVLSTTPPCVKASVHGCKQIHTSGRVSKPKKPKGARDSTITRALRVQGVCVACFYQKDRCDLFNPDDPCRRCQRLMGGDLLGAQRICFRDDEKVIQARIKIPDFFETAGRASLPMLHCNSCGSKTRIVRLGHPPQIIGNEAHLIDGESLSVEVRECFDLNELLCTGVPSPDSPDGEGLRSLDAMRRRYIGMAGGLSTENPENVSSPELICILHKLLEQYTITPESLPTPEKLAEWGGYDIQDKAKLFPNDVASNIDAFFCAYIDHIPELPYCELIKNILIITKLGRYLDNRRPVDYDNIQRAKGEGLLDIKQWRFAARISQRARTQIFHQAIKGIEKYEPLVLETLDRLVSRKRYTKNPVILGLCVRRLSLFYRHIMARYKRLGEDVVQRYQNGKDMYDALTRHYARTFRGTLSPFDEEWNNASHKDAFDNDADLLSKFENLKIAERYHYETEVTQEDDCVYVRLCLEGGKIKPARMSRG